MKKIFYFSFILMCLCLTGCKKELIGNYEMIQMNNGENVITQYDLKSYGISFILTIQNNGKAILNEGNIVTNLTYDGEKFVSINQNAQEKRELKYSVDGEKIILDESGDKMIFQKKS